MPKSKRYVGIYEGMIVEILVETHPTQKQLQDWKDLWTWLMTPRHDADIARDELLTDPR